MRTTILLAGAALMTAGTALAQAPGAPFPPPGVQHPPMPPAPRSPMGAPMGAPMGMQHQGRWWGGANAPGGWASYRQPYRGYRVPRYWIAPRFYVNDWSRYGLYQPSGGATWVRYYDDAVLIDSRGEVQDWRGGLDWDGGGYAHDEGHDRHGPPPGYGYDDRGPPPMMHDGPPPHRDERRVIIRRDGGAGGWVSQDGRTTVTTTTSGGYGGGYGGGGPVIVQPGYGYGYGGSVTTITIQSAPVVTTTTTTEIVEDAVTYTRPVVRHVARRVWRPRPVRVCPPVVRHRHRAPAVLGS